MVLGKKVAIFIRQWGRNSNWSILQYFRPSLSYHLSLRPLVCLFLSGRFTQVLLYMYICSWAYCKGVIGLTVPVNMLSFTIHVPAISTASQVIVQP